MRERKDWVNFRECALNACSLKQEYILSADTPRPTFYSQCKSLASAKKTKPNLKIPRTHVLQQVLRTLEAAFVGMWEQGRGFPRFKKRMRSFLYPQLNKVPVQGEMLNLPKIGSVKMRLSRPLPEGYELKQVRVVRKASGFCAMLILQSSVEIPQPMPSGHEIGIDLAATLSRNFRRRVDCKTSILRRWTTQAGVPVAFGSKTTLRLESNQSEGFVALRV